MEGLTYNKGGGGWVYAGGGRGPNPGYRKTKKSGK